MLRRRGPERTPLSSVAARADDMVLDLHSQAG
jgi:hypothetical protein